MIIKSKLDIDLYKFKMLYFLWATDQLNIPVVYRFFNRTPIKLEQYVSMSEVQMELSHFRNNFYSAKELDYLCTLFEPAFVEFLHAQKISNAKVIPKTHGFGFDIEGTYSNVILHETALLSIVNELYCRRILEAIDPEIEEHYRKTNLANSIYMIQDTDIRFTEFGTRRRFSADWQDAVVNSLRIRLPNNLIGTSNVYLAMRYSLNPVGTIAHEMHSFYAATQPTEIHSQSTLVKEYARIFPETFFLTDTFGTQDFLDNCCEEDEHLYGLRQDSGSTTAWMNALEVKFPSSLPRPKIMFSDGLNAVKIKELHEQYSPRWDCCFGWGTNLTNNGLIKPLSIVMKLWKADKKYCVKLSDNPHKAVGHPREVEKYKWLFNYNKNITHKEKAVY